MGYTHYQHQKREVSPEAWEKICDATRKIIEEADAPLAFEYNEPDEEPLIDGECIRFNGIEDDGHETFVLNRRGSGFSFCKTARKPYDIVVCAILIVAEHFSDGAFDVSSDGRMDEEEWAPALRLAQSILPGVQVPPNIR